MTVTNFEKGGAGIYLDLVFSLALLPTLLQHVSSSGIAGFDRDGEKPICHDQTYLNARTILFVHGTFNVRVLKPWDPIIIAS